MGKYDNDGLDIDLDDFEDSSEGFKKLRAALKKANERNAALAEENKTLSGKVARVTVKDVLTAKKANPAIGRFILQDGVDVTDEAAVDEWLKENGSLFGFTPGASAPSGESQTPAESEGGASNLADEFTRLMNASEGAQLDTSNLQGAKALLGAQSSEEVDTALAAALAQLGAGGN